MKFLKEFKEIAIVFVCVFVFRSSFLNWYLIPSGSMLPTLKIGDHVVVNKLSYGFMLPFMETRIMSWEKPKKGDIVVFQGPESEKNLTLIKRVVGVEGDVVTFTHGVLTINGKTATEAPVFDQEVGKNFGGNESSDPFNIYLESGFSNKPHYIMRLKYGGPTESETQTWVVPPGQLLLMGDNRDNSQDGRYWGFMDEKRIYGQAFLISYSTYDEPGSILPKFRSDRWFKKIED